MNEKNCYKILELFVNKLNTHPEKDDLMTYIKTKNENNETAFHVLADKKISIGNSIILQQMLKWANNNKANVVHHSKLKISPNCVNRKWRI